MNRLKMQCVAAVVTVLPLCAQAGDFDGSKPLLCASIDVMECTPGNGCSEVSSDTVDAPQFLKVDLANNKLTGRRSGGIEHSSEIERSENIEEKLILQGAEQGREGVRDGLGWTMSITQDTGTMVLTASGDAAAFVIFGACTPL